MTRTGSRLSAANTRDATRRIPRVEAVPAIIGLSLRHAGDACGQSVCRERRVALERSERAQTLLMGADAQGTRPAIPGSKEMSADPLESCTYRSTRE